VRDAEKWQNAGIIRRTLDERLETWRGTTRTSPAQKCDGMRADFLRGLNGPQRSPKPGAILSMVSVQHLVQGCRPADL